MAKKIITLLIASCLILFIKTQAQRANAITSAKPVAPSNAEPLGSCPLVILSFYPSAASTGDTVTIQLIMPCEVDSVWFGGVPAIAIAGSPQYTGLVRAVVAGGNSGDVRIKNQWGPATKNGFTFLPPVALPKPVKLCPPVASATLNAEIIGQNYRWQQSTDSSSFTDITNSEHYDSVTSAKLILSNIPSNWTGKRYRCIAGNDTSRVFVLIFQNEFLQRLNSSWENASNWGCGVEPDENTDVIITQSVIVLSSDATINSLTIVQGAKFTIAEGFTLTIKK